ncbi:heavy-metal-associated domain-containing protein [Thalassobius sp. Cn5-15]|jgi:copper chaperone CopZ|uniref:heavy-metal-associated domain-containing protein n=1 Tax=Thalassobius sp. Cn5-15 TaxID=2917763 RepID=UPI001EF3C6E3|nr:heavy metal-associated domain-containing protein [Thalassobius sp. Cn5-15]MCG7494267.1 heavy-metal-associated domain-containing protein [Thalassobius sp. Cn5-15]
MITFNVPTMHCGKCSAKIKAAVQNLDPTALLTFDMQARTVEVDSADPVEDLAQAITASGFEATPA